MKVFIISLLVLVKNIVVYAYIVFNFIVFMEALRIWFLKKTDNHFYLRPDTIARIDTRYTFSNLIYHVMVNSTFDLIYIRVVQIPFSEKCKLILKVYYRLAIFYWIGIPRIFAKFIYNLMMFAHSQENVQNFISTKFIRRYDDRFLVLNNNTWHINGFSWDNIFNIVKFRNPTTKEITPANPRVLRRFYSHIEGHKKALKEDLPGVVKPLSARLMLFNPQTYKEIVDRPYLYNKAHLIIKGMHVNKEYVIYQTGTTFDSDGNRITHGLKSVASNIPGVAIGRNTKPSDWNEIREEYLRAFSTNLVNPNWVYDISARFIHYGYEQSLVSEDFTSNSKRISKTLQDLEGYRKSNHLVYVNQGGDVEILKHFMDDILP